MGIEYRIPTDADWPAVVRADGRAFGEVPTDEQIAERRSTVDLDRFRIAVDGTQIVGVAGSFAFDVTLPGGATAPAAGLTWVGVNATQRGTTWCTSSANVRRAGAARRSTSHIATAMRRTGSATSGRVVPRTRSNWSSSCP